MATKPKNLLVIMSDEHNPKVMGHAGHPVISTPAMDALAARGTRFPAAYTPAPICVPARAAFATGLHPHRNRCWDNAISYDGSMPSWHHALRARGHAVTSIGKLHFQGLKGQDYGFTEMILPMQVTGGTGDLTLLIRDPEDVREGGAKKLIAEAGPGESSYTLYDRQVTAAAQTWLHEKGTQQHDKPWVLFVSLVAPHFPLTAPPEHYYRYAKQQLPTPKLPRIEDRPTHPYTQIYGHRSAHARFMKDECDVQRALAGYFGLVSFLDENIGKILKALEDAGLAADTRVAYTSDHGDNLGTRALWGKATMYEESAGIPMILAGPDVPQGAACPTPVDLCDLAATILDAVGAGDAIAELKLDGASLLDLANRPPVDRTALSQFHSYGPDGQYMLRTLRWKYIHHVAFPPQLFDLENDPEEMHDLGTDPALATTRAELEARLRNILDPEAVDAAAKADQARAIAAHGGEEAIRKRERAAYTLPPTASAA
jgi:choline-sulfatase